MSILRGILRAFAFCTLLLNGALLVFLTGWLPVKFRGTPLGPWIVHGVAAAFTYLLGVRIHVSDPRRWKNHSGFIFTNHTTYVDILTIFATTPVRFVAKAEIRSWPVIGYLGEAIGCVFVQRDDRQSRQRTRQVLALMDHQPPVVLFPEGKTAPYGTLLPFRKGAFEIAHAGEVPILPAAIIYGDPRLIEWKRRHPLRAWWEMLSRPGLLHAQVILLDTIQPVPADDPLVLCESTRALMLRRLVETGEYGEDDDVEGMIAPDSGVPNPAAEWERNR